MSRPNPADEYVAEPNALERRGAAYLRARNPRERAELRPRREAELAEVRRIQRRAVTWAFLAGALSGVILGITEQLGMRGYEDASGWREQWPWWAGLIGAALVVSGLEILFLYWNAMRAAGRVSRLAGISFIENADAELLARGQARAALEFPNPRDHVFGIDPYARVPGWKLTLWTLLYKMKVGVSSFVLRVLLRRVLGRAALRSLIPLLMGPLYAIWNAIITWRIVREARLRAFGPFAVDSVVERLAGRRVELDDSARELILQASGEMLMRSQDAHPNLVFLLTRLFQVLERPAQATAQRLQVDWAASRARLGDLNPAGRDALLEVLQLAAVLDGRVRKAERELLRELHQAFGREFRRAQLDELQRKLMAGRYGGR